MTQVLPSGATVELVHADVIKERQRRQVRLIVNKLTPAAQLALMNVNDGDHSGLANLTPNDSVVLYELNDLMAVFSIQSWSYPFPVTMETIQDLPGDDYDACLKLSAPMIHAFFGTDFGPDAEGAPNPT